MSAMSTIQDFLAQHRIAVVGVSHNPKDFSRTLLNELRQRGYDVVAVNPELKDVDGEACFVRLQDIQPGVDGAILMTSPGVTKEVVHDCAEAGITRVWMYRAGTKGGAVSDEAIRYCVENGISVVPGECPFMFLPGAGWFHRTHGLIRKITGNYPHWEDLTGEALPLQSLLATSHYPPATIFAFSGSGSGPARSKLRSRGSASAELYCERDDRVRRLFGFESD